MNANEREWTTNGAFASIGVHSGEIRGRESLLLRRPLRNAEESKETESLAWRCAGMLWHNPPWSTHAAKAGRCARSPAQEAIMDTKSGDGSHLADAVYKAFADVSYPGDENLLAEDCCDEAEVASLKSQPWNSHWATVPRDVIEWHAGSLPHLSAEAFRFYLPAFMRYVLDKPDSEVPVLPFLVYALLNMADPAMKHGKQRAVDRRKMELLSAEQRAVILDFLAYVRNVLRDPMCLPEATRAIEALEGSM